MKEFNANIIQNTKIPTHWEQSLEIGNKLVKFKLETGAACNVLPFKIFKSIKFEVKPVVNTNVK